MDLKPLFTPRLEASPVSRFSEYVFDLRAFVLAFSLSLVLLVAGSVLIPGPLTFVGPAVGGAVVARRGRRYVEAALAGAFAAGSGVVFEYALTAMGAPSAAAVGTGTGAVAALLGHYVARRFIR